MAGGKARVCIIGLDGTPHSLLQRMLTQGIMPHTAAVAGRGSLRRMTSVYPWVSAVAWSTFMTGCNPAKHGIFGFVDRNPATFKTYIPTPRHMQAEPLWDILSRHGKQVIVLNVPGTFPPHAINGVLVSDFLSPSLEKAVYPASLLPMLKQMGYRIDSDPWLARSDRQSFLPDLRDTLEKRTRTFLHLMDTQPWDFYMGVIMETDRLHHFLFEQMEQDDPVYAPAFFAIYRQIDEFIGQVLARLSSDDTLILLSDHGFCSIRREVYFNRWLYEAGYLRFRQMPPKDLADVSPDSLAYSLDPGRVFINLQGRERDGRVAPGREYEELRSRLIAEVEALRDPETGERLVLRGYRREELYHGPALAAAADIILAPANGYDPKGALWRDYLTHKDPSMVGMHTYDDAMCLVGSRSQIAETVSIMDIMPTILQMMDVPAPATLDGHSLLS